MTSFEQLFVSLDLCSYIFTGLTIMLMIISLIQLITIWIKFKNQYGLQSIQCLVKLTMFGVGEPICYSIQLITQCLTENRLVNRIVYFWSRSIWDICNIFLSYEIIRFGYLSVSSDDKSKMRLPFICFDHLKNEKKYWNRYYGVVILITIAIFITQLSNFILGSVFYYIFTGMFVSALIHTAIFQTISLMQFRKVTKGNRSKFILLFQTIVCSLGIVWSVVFSIAAVTYTTMKAFCKNQECTDVANALNYLLYIFGLAIKLFLSLNIILLGRVTIRNLVQQGGYEDIADKNQAFV